MPVTLTTPIYEQRLRADPRWAMEEGGLHFEKQSAIHRTLRKFAAKMEELDIPFALSGAMAMFLHGYRRTTTDVDVYAADRRALAEALQAKGFNWNDETRQFEQGDFVVQILAPTDNLPYHPTSYTEIDGVRVVTLGDLISMKLSVGTKHIRRTQDLADVVRLIETLKLDKSFLPQVAREYRPDYRELVDKIEKES